METLESTRTRGPQQATLSIRAHDSVKERLERARQLLSQNTGHRVSISDVAKLYLESTIRDDVLLEVIQLLDKPTESLLTIRRKWEGGHPLSRAEWNLMGYYVCQGAERLPENPCPYRETIAELLEAFLAVRALRAEPRVAAGRNRKPGESSN